MLKALIVDDEPIIRAGLRQLIDWDRYGWEICGEAGDATSARQALGRLHPDLVLLDIRLPGALGLDLIEEYPATPFIVLSGYTDFDYACKALNLGAKAYIVKPIDEEILIQKVTAVRKEIAQEKIQAEQALQARNSSQAAASRDAALHILHAIEGTATLPPTSCLVQAALIDGADAAGVLERDLQDFFSPIAKDKIIFAPYRNRLAVFFRDIQEGEALRLLERFSARRRNRVDIALGPQCSGTTGAPAWRESFRTAEELIKQAFFYKEKLVLHSSPQTGSNNYLKIFENRTLELSAFIKLIDPEKIKVFFKNFEYEAINSGKNPQEIREEYITLLIQTRDLVEKDFPTLKDLSSKKMLDLCIEAPYLADISENFSRFFIGYSQNLPRISADSAFQRILTYVRNNYTQPLCLKTISQLFNQNPAYLGKLWKKQTGFKFHTYLDKLRIEAATELLLQTNMKVYEIAKAVGYEDPDYFYTKFKKHSGKSPLDFRRT